jgi:hypothetical protein
LAKNAVSPNSFKLLLNESQDQNKESESLLKANDNIEQKNLDESLQKNNLLVSSLKVVRTPSSLKLQNMVKLKYFSRIKINIL